MSRPYLRKIPDHAKRFSSVSTFWHVGSNWRDLEAQSIQNVNMAGPVLTLGDLSSSVNTPDAVRKRCDVLERGGILILPPTVLNLSTEDRLFLDHVQHNVSFRPKESPSSASRLFGIRREEIRGFGDDLHRARMRRILETYAAESVRVVEQLLTPYTGYVHAGFTALRAEEEQGRKNSAGKRSDLLHINAFPDLPTWGGRILRVFTNLSDSRPRVWEIGEGFERLAEQYAEAAGLEQAIHGALDRMAKKLRRFFPTYEFAMPRATFEDRPPYDRFMLRFHDWMEERAGFQRNARKERIEFPPGASWMVFTDGVPHAVVSGRPALDQTLLVDYAALVAPDAAPLTILEWLSGKKLI